MVLNAEVLKPHVSINVRDIGRSIEFYSKMFGIAPSKVRKRYAKFDVSVPALNLALNEAEFCCDEAPGCCTSPLSHLGIQVAGKADVLSVRKQWSEAGLLPRDEMQTECCYAVQDKTWVRDPDGNEWEVFVVLADYLPEKAAPQASC